MHIKDARKIIDSGLEFSCKLWKSNGEVLAYNRVKKTSSYFKNDTFNVVFIESKQVRKIRIISIFEINDEEIYL